MKLKQYPKYKDSGVQWIGEIPEDWRNYKLKHIISQFISGGTPSSDNEKFWATDEEKGIQWVAIRDMSNKEYVKETAKQITNKGLADKNLTILKKGTLLYSIFASLGKVSILDIDATTNQAILGLIPSKKIKNKFLKYYLISLEETIISLSNANTQNNLNLSIVKNIDLGLSLDLREQTQIATFLDSKTQNISQTIEKNKELIELLKEKRTALINHVVTKGLDKNAKMKDSRIDWIGEIPDEWSIRKLKHITKLIIDGTHFTPEYIEKGIPFLRVTDIQSDKIDFDKIKYISEKESRELNYRCDPQKGDLLLSKNGTIGIPKIIDWDYQFSIFVSLCLIKLNNKVNVNFLKYFILSRSIKEQILYRSKTTSVTNLHLDQIKEFIISYPDKKEQLQIVKYLDAQTQKIDQTINKIQEKITLMQEYKKSLIHHVVTGKIDVRGVEA